MIKIDVISGFLGAGKTTLIKKIFETVLKNEKVVLIENEFGEIGIDGSFLKESGIQIKEINAGCICCSLVGDFSTSMKEVIDTYHPERIIIEPSGVGKLSDIVNAVLELKEDIQLNILATVVDGVKTKMYLKNFGEFFNNQVEAANTIVISKTDKMTEEKVLEVVELIKQKNDHATIITTAISELDSEQLMKVLEAKVSLKEEIEHEMKHAHHHHDEECCCGHHHEHKHHHHDEECCCGHHHEHEHHHHDEECCCGHHHEHEHHHHDEECCCGHHHEHEHHHHDEECCCGHHHEHEHHHHDEECCCGHHHEHEHHHHDEECCCGHHHEHEHHHHDEECCCGHHHEHGHHADEVFTSWGKETAKSVSYDELNKFLNTLATDESLGIIIRSKGILKANDNEKWYYYDFVSGDYEIRLGNPDYTGRIVVIGSKMDEKKIEELFFNNGK